ncbi:MAG: hypothetical protein AAAB11_15445, partial [Rhizobium giardinii]
MTLSPATGEGLLLSATSNLGAITPIAPGAKENWSCLMSEALERYIDQGVGREPADIVLKGGRFF